MSSIEGTVIGIAYVQARGCTCYLIRVVRKVWGGAHQPWYETASVPVNGTPKIGGGVTRHVEKLED